MEKSKSCRRLTVIYEMICNKSLYLVLKIAVYTVLIFEVNLYSKPDTISIYNSIRYEYCNLNTTERNPIVICVPGFTQHNQSPEFYILKDFLAKNNFSYLIMNPPQHGEDITRCDKIFTWGEDEVKDLHELIKHLKIGEKHSEAHLLGFSIGAKVVLKYAACFPYQSFIKSVIPVAAPYRVGDINFRLSGDIKKPTEGLASGVYALDRTDICRLAEMVLIGMPKALCVNKASPANDISSIKVPILLLHGADDWLTKSFHSVKLFNNIGEQHQASLITLDTRSHADDMLTRDKSDLRYAFLEILKTWFKFIKQDSNPKQKINFNKTFAKILSKSRNIENYLYDNDKITYMNSPTFYDPNGKIWMIPPDKNSSILSIHNLNNVCGDKGSEVFINGGFTKYSNSILNKIQVGLGAERRNNKCSSYEGYLSLYYPFGSFLWFKRLNYVHGIDNTFNRRILSADLALLIVDLRFSYGNFFNSEQNSLLSFNFPLIGNASGLYFLGIGYSRFISSIPNSIKKDNLKAYLFIGPKIRALNSRLQLSLQYDTNKGDYKQNTNWGIGISLYINEL